MIILGQRPFNAPSHHYLCVCKQLLLATNLVIIMGDTKVVTNPEKKIGGETKIVELELPIEEITRARINTESPIGLSREMFGSLGRFANRETQATRTQSLQPRIPTPTLDIRHPVLTFIDEITTALRNCSDQFLRPKQTMGIVNTVRKDIDLTELLSALEAGEKRLGLVSHSKPSLDVMANNSRHLAHEAEFIVRGLRRSIVTTSSDPAHPGEQKASTVFEAVDMVYHQLYGMKLKFEDLSTELFIQIQLHEQEGPVN
jgi:hypothetical protein